VLLAFLGNFNLYTVRVNLSVAIVALTENRNVSMPDGTVINEPYFDWSSQEKGFALGAFFYGYILTQFLGGYAASKYGGLLVFGLGILGSAIMTLLTPVLCYQGIYYLYAARILIGIFSGLAFPSANAIYGKWSPPLEVCEIFHFSLQF
jgi:MFS transporter, ACS family, solute carrier family 17 (sodium-dependent inorganic phosphate cotransporter), other